MRHSSFTDIGQFRNTIKSVKMAYQFVGLDDDGEAIVDRNATPPIITFKGTVKSHGSNAGVAQDKDGEIWYQSRGNIITPEKDNAGFAFFAESHKEVFKSFFADLREITQIHDKTIVIFGEWCGGNIQKGVALNGLPKMLIIFAVKIVTDDETENYYLNEETWAHLKSPDEKIAPIYNINDFESFTIDIDFANPLMAQNKLIEITEGVEKECPIGKAFGRKLGEDNTTGEGVVWVGWYKGSRYIFKVKGEKHSSSKVKKLAPVDTEKLNSINEFVEYACTENRLNQAIEQVFTVNDKAPDITAMGDFIRWVIKDIMKEEIDTFKDNKLEPKDVNKYISNVARKWFMTYLNSEAGIE